MRQELIDLFWSQVQKTDSCWLWTGPLNWAGYGELRSHRFGFRRRAHRVSYELHKGGINNDLRICHSCDNPRCVNPEHLWEGTDKDNSDDKVSKFRQATGPSLPQAKLSYTKIGEAMDLYMSSNLTQAEVADRLGINQSTLSRALNRKTWRHGGRK